MDKESIKSIDSYTERRKLFKNIWDTAIEMDEKDKDYVNAPMAKRKVIKTLRLNDEDGINIGKNKKRRIKNLRTVCTRLLDICDKQDADDLVYDQMSTARQDSSLTSIMFAHRRKHKKKLKKKKVKIVIKDTEESQPLEIQDTPSFYDDTDGPVTHRGTIPMRDMNSPRMERTALIKQFLKERYNLKKALPEPDPDPNQSDQVELEDVPHKVVKKKKYRRKSSNTSSPMRRPASTSTRVPTNTVKKKNTNDKDDLPLIPLRELPGGF